VDLPIIGPVDWSFLAGPYTVTATNTGSFNLSELALVGAVADPHSHLAHDAWLCLGTTGIGTGGTFEPYFWGRLDDVDGRWFALHGHVLTTAGTTPTPWSAPTDNWVVWVTAGPDHVTPCGATPSWSPGLDNFAEGQSTTFSLSMRFRAK
jgi:hypothetical protein